MTKNEMYVAEAKEMMKEFFSNRSCSKRVLATLDHHKNINENGVIDGEFHSGCFRTAYVPSSRPFVIKTAIRKSGNAQCEREANTYADAVEQGFSRYFAKFYGSFTFRRHTFYVFQKVENTGKFWFNHYDDLMSDYAYRKGLKNFMDDHGINDLHGGNFGKIGRTYVLTDYAGCYCDEWN